MGHARRHSACARTLIAGAIALAAAACDRSASAPQTASEFIEAYTAAYRAQDADRIMALRYDLELARKAGVSEDLAEAISGYSRVRDREALEQSLRTNDTWAQAWVATTLESERRHGDHIHVTVNVRGATTEIVLVRDGGMLKIHPRPSMVN
jgi:hypothetical protein